MSLSKFNQWLVKLEQVGVLYVITRDYTMITVEDESHLLFALKECLGEAYVFSNEKNAYAAQLEIHEVLCSFLHDYEEA